MDRDHGANFVYDVWHMAEAPLQLAGEGEWATLFSWVGFARNGARARRPRKVMSLYRGAVEGHEVGSA